MVIPKASMSFFKNTFRGGTPREPAGQRPALHHSQGGWLVAEITVALTILVAVLIPVSFSFLNDQKAMHGAYYRAVAMELVDGEMEILQAGEWRSFKQGAQPYMIHAGAITNLPPGRFLLTLEGPRLKLEWAPEKKGHGGKIARECYVH